MAGRSLPVEDEWKARALVFRGQRQAVLAANLANADTPGYRARDASFAQALQGATGAAGALGMNTTSAAHARGAAVAIPRSTLDFAATLQPVAPVQPRLDGNTVEPDRERGAFVSNSVLYQFALSLVDDELKEFRMASSDPLKQSP